MGHAKSFCRYSISSSVVREFLAEYLGIQYLDYMAAHSSLQEPSCWLCSGPPQWPKQFCPFTITVTP